MSAYKTYLCGPSQCPHDPAFEHDGYFGCVPKDFNQRLGTSKTYRQTRVESAQFASGVRHLWNGGCDERTRAALPQNESERA